MDVCYTLAAVPLDSDMELLSSDLQNQAPVKFWKVLMVLPVFRVSTNWNSSSLLMVWWFYCYCFAFLLYPLDSFGDSFQFGGYDLGYRTWILTSRTSSLQKPSWMHKCMDALNSWETLEKRRCLVVEDLLVSFWPGVIPNSFFFWDGCDKNHQKL